MFKYSVFFEFILKSCKLVSYICLVFLFAILFKVNKCGMNVLSVAYDTEELTTPRFYVSLYTQTMRPPSVSLTYIRSQTKAPFISELLLRQLILNNEPQGESGDRKAHSFPHLKSDWAWSLKQSLFSHLYMNNAWPMFWVCGPHKLKDKKMKVFIS